MVQKIWLAIGGLAAFIVIGNVIEYNSGDHSQEPVHDDYVVVGLGNVEIAPTYAAESARSSVVEAVDYWRARGYDIEFTEGAHYNVRVDFIREYGSPHLGLAYQRFVQISLGDSNCGGIWAKKWTPYAPDSVLEIATHELGHALGLEHNLVDPADIMFPTTEPRYGRPCGFEGEHQFEPGERQTSDIPFSVEYPVDLVLEGDGGGNYYNICHRMENASDYECSEPGFDPARLEIRAEPGLHWLRLICRTNSKDCLVPYLIELQPDPIDLIDT